MIVRKKKYSHGGVHPTREEKRQQMLSTGRFTEGPNGELIRVPQQDMFGFPTTERAQQLSESTEPLNEQQLSEYIRYGFSPTNPVNTAFSMIAGAHPAAAAADVVGNVIGKGVAYGAGYLSRLSPAANKVLGYLGAGKKARKADRDFDDYSYGYTDEYDDPIPVRYPSDNMPFGRGERAAADMLERKRMREYRNRIYNNRMEQLKDFYGNDIPEPLVALARARKVGDRETIKRLSEQNMAEVDRLIEALPDRPVNTPESDMKLSLLLERMMDQ